MDDSLFVDDDEKLSVFVCELKDEELDSLKLCESAKTAIAVIDNIAMLFFIKLHPLLFSTVPE